MKKILLTSLAALALASCVSDNDLQPVDGTRGYGKLLVSISNDPTIQTRADGEGVNSGTVAGVDVASWVYKVTDDQSKTITWSTTNNTVTAGTYTVLASNYKNVAEALEANKGWGAAFYSNDSQTDNENTVEIAAGGTGTAKIKCGAAKNGRLKLNVDEAAKGIISEYSLKVTSTKTQTENTYRSLTFKKESDGNNTLDAIAYFEAGDQLTWEFSFKLSENETAGNKELKSSDNDKISISAATETTFQITTDQSGTLTVTIHVNENFESDTKEIKINAATGEVVPTPEQTT